MVATATTVSFSVAGVLESCPARDGLLCPDDASTSTVGCLSEIGFQSADCTARLPQENERWCDLSEDGFSADGSGALVATKSRRRRHRRSKRAKAGLNNVVSQSVHRYSKNNALERPVFEDRATQALVDLGLMTSTPERNDPMEKRSTPGEEVLGYEGNVATVSLHMPASCPTYSREAADSPPAQQYFPTNAALQFFPTSTTFYLYVPQDPCLIGSIHAHPPLSR